jgi:hypothetical protein
VRAFKIEKAEQGVPRSASEQTLEQMLTQDDGLRLDRERLHCEPRRSTLLIYRNYMRKLCWMKFRFPNTFTS